MEERFAIAVTRHRAGSVLPPARELKLKGGICLAWRLVPVFILAAAGAASDGQSFGNPEVRQWPPSRTYHVENYQLTLQFDQAKGEVLGDEAVTLRPFERHFRKFYLDSAELTIDAVTLEPERGAPVGLLYAAEGERLWITLDREYDRTGRLRVRILYHGFPRTGLFFVNPTPSYPNRPRQVFSQGEAEFNHFWFPCWDYPNDMATSETITTVPEGQTVVSNGKLVKVTRSSGQVTYDWRESIPHSSYLISVAVGPWRKFTDNYKGKPVDYYVGNSVDEATARRSFHLTPDMIGFFSRATGVDYPYEQYAQTAVENFPFGGQENVSATTLTDRTLHDARADQDYPSTNLVSHELGQHWFGDYVQGRDWANIWLNEGFATYLEALYTQHQEGNDAYRFAIYNDQLAEQQEDRDSYRRPIVDRHYRDAMEMFDRTTHEKGAAVLDMLRYCLDGSEAASDPASQNELFFQALHHYLIEHHAQSTDTAGLIEALRSTTGQELGWFFDEWVFRAGRPDYQVAARYDATTRMEKVSVAQRQAADRETPVFDMPIELAFYGAHGERKRTQVRDHLRQQEFDVPLDFEPQWVDFDPEDFIDKTVQFDTSVAALVAQAEKDPSMMSRLWAVEQLGTATLPNPQARVEALRQILGADRFYAVRAAAAASLGGIGGEAAKSALLAATRQPDSRVRTAVIAALGTFAKDRALDDVWVDALHHDASYAVEAAAATNLGKSGAAEAFDVLEAEALAKPEIHVMQATFNALVATEDPRAVKILVAEAQPGVPERIRLSALAGLAGLKEAAAHDDARELADVVRAALHDPFFPLREQGEELVGVFHLTQFEAELQTEAQGAPMAFERAAAQKALERLHPRP